MDPTGQLIAHRKKTGSLSGKKRMSRHLDSALVTCLSHETQVATWGAQQGPRCQGEGMFGRCPRSLCSGLHMGLRSRLPRVQRDPLTARHTPGPLRGQSELLPQADTVRTVSLPSPAQEEVGKVRIWDTQLHKRQSLQKPGDNGRERERVENIL